MDNNKQPKLPTAPHFHIRTLHVLGQLLALFHGDNSVLLQIRLVADEDHRWTKNKKMLKKNLIALY